MAELRLDKSVMTEILFLKTDALLHADYNQGLFAKANLQIVLFVVMELLKDLSNVMMETQETMMAVRAFAKYKISVETEE